MLKDRQQSWLQFVTTKTPETDGTCLMLHFPDQRYLFGHMSEGLQRACIQRSVPMRYVSNLFLTGTVDWAHHGGLLGWVLTAADVQALSDAHQQRGQPRPRLNIFSSPGLLHTVACARRFIFRTGMPLTIHECEGTPFHWTPDPTYVDNNIRVWALPIRPQPSAAAASEDSSDVGTIQMEQDMRRGVVTDMFDSDWRRDRLVQLPFKDVKLPATVFVREPTTKSLERIFCTSMDDAPHIAPDQLVQVRNAWPAALTGRLPRASNLPLDVSTSYIVKGHLQRGVFVPDKAKELGVRPGPVYKELAAGGSITLEDGRTITSDMVTEHPQMAKGCAIFDVPSLAYLTSLRTLLKNRHTDMLSDVGVMIWILGHGLSATSEFHDLKSSLKDFQHVVDDAETSQKYPPFESVTLSTARLAKILPSNFPGSFQKTDAIQEIALPVLRSDSSETQMAHALPGLKVIMEPDFALKSDEVTIGETREKLVQVISAGHDRKTADPPMENDHHNEPEFVMLGTGSATPSKYRNVSATLIRMPGNLGNYLLDCGENTIGQLKRIYPKEQLGPILRNLRGIWISHLHADHHLGTISVLRERAKAFDEIMQYEDRTIYLISEVDMLDFLFEYSSVEPWLSEPSSGIIPVACQEGRGPEKFEEPFDFTRSKSGIKELKSVRVSHCNRAQAVAITFKDGFKLAYSGDCRPSNKFCDIGQNADVLVHEATFDDDLEGDAQAKKHCTTSEALGVAQRMKAKNVILTHFSQRYHKVPNFQNVKPPSAVRFEEATKAQDDEPVDDGSLPVVGSPPSAPEYTSNVLAPAPPNLNICVAFDYMRVRPSEIAGMKDYYAAIQAMFDEQQRIADEKRAVRREAMEEMERKRVQRKESKHAKHEEQRKQVGARKRKEKEEARRAKQEKREANGRVIEDVNDKKLAQSVEVGEQTAERGPHMPGMETSPAQTQSQLLQQDMASTSPNQDQISPSSTLKRISLEDQDIAATQEQPVKRARSEHDIGVGVAPGAAGASQLPPE